MYKRMTIDQILSVKNNFLVNLKTVMGYERIDGFKEFLRTIGKVGPETMFMQGSDALMRFLFEGDIIRIIDEKEKIELLASGDVQNTLHSKLKKSKHELGNNKLTTMYDILEKDFSESKFDSIFDKPYIVYDIETSNITDDIMEHEFFMAYFIDSVDKKYRYVDRESLRKFYEYLRDFDGYIVGYNHLYYDNPVVIKNLGLTEDDLQHLQSKSIDIFIFFQHLTGKRFGLSKVGKALVGFDKTLESGADGSKMISEYLATNNQEILDVVKEYCKNDVKLTLFVLLYIFRYKELSFDGEKYDITVEQFVDLSKQSDIKNLTEKKDMSQNSIFL